MKRGGYSLSEEEMSVYRVWRVYEREFNQPQCRQIDINLNQVYIVKSKRI